MEQKRAESCVRDGDIGDFNEGRLNASETRRRGLPSKGFTVPCNFMDSLRERREGRE